MLGPSPSLQRSAETKTEKEISYVWYHTFCFYSLIRRALSEAPVLGSNSKSCSPEKPRQLACCLNFSRSESFTVRSLAEKKKKDVSCIACTLLNIKCIISLCDLFVPTHQIKNTSVDRVVRLNTAFIVHKAKVLVEVFDSWVATEDQTAITAWQHMVLRGHVANWGQRKVRKSE